MKSKLKKLGRWSALPAIALLAALMLYNGILNLRKRPLPLSC